MNKPKKTIIPLYTSLKKIGKTYIDRTLRINPNPERIKINIDIKSSPIHYLYYCHVGITTYPTERDNAPKITYTIMPDTLFEYLSI